MYTDNIQEIELHEVVRSAVLSCDVENFRSMLRSVFSDSEIQMMTAFFSEDHVFLGIGYANEQGEMCRWEDSVKSLVIKSLESMYVRDIEMIKQMIVNTNPYVEDIK